MFAVAGATGQLGIHVMRYLMERLPASHLVAFARDLDKAEPFLGLGVNVREAEYEKPETLHSALVGVKRLLLIASNSGDRRTIQHRAVIEAAAQAGVERIVYTSLLHADKSSMLLAQMHRETEELLKTCGIEHIIARNGWYIENLYPRIRSALASGSLQGCAGRGQISCAARVDYAAGVGALLLTENAAPRTIYETAGTQSLTFADLAREVARQAGRPVLNQDLSYDQYKAV